MVKKKAPKSIGKRSDSMKVLIPHSDNIGDLVLFNGAILTPS